MSGSVQSSLQGCHVISLRPADQHGSLRRVAAQHGAKVVALSPWRIRACTGSAASQQLSTALAAERVVFTSPAAVAAAAALQPLPERASGKHWLAVGSGTAAALLRVGVTDVTAPRRMDSEGLLCLDALQSVAGQAIGLVTAPGGRGEIARILGERGARVLRADVYRREPLTLTSRALQRLLQIDGSMWLALSSGEALQRVIEQLPPTHEAHLLRAAVSAASERLGTLARAYGFARVVVARSARPADLIQAAAGINEQSHRNCPDRPLPIR